MVIVILSDGPFFNVKQTMLIKKDPDLISSFLEDYSNLKGGSCELVAFPDTEKEVSDFFKECFSLKIPVTISGAGTGVAAGRIPFSGRVLSLSKFNTISPIKKISGNFAEVTVGAGVVLADFLDYVKSKGFFYPPDPTEKTSFLGGNIATGASGARSFKYGTTRDFVLGIKVVLSSGEVLDLNRGKFLADKAGKFQLITESNKEIVFSVPKYLMPNIKNATGYYTVEGMDAVDLFIGSEGTLGVIIEARLKLIKALEGLLDCYAFFNRKEDAFNFVIEAYNSSKNNNQSEPILNPISIEYFDKGALSLLRERHSNIPKDAEAAIYFEQEVTKKNEDDVISEWAKLITKSEGSLDDTWFAHTEKDRKHLQDVRHDLPDLVNERVKRSGFKKIGTDIAVPFSCLPDMLTFYQKLLSTEGLEFVIFGHIGDAHLHVNILPKNNYDIEKGLSVYKNLVKKAISLGGTPSAEHGIGKVKHEYLKMLYPDEAVNEMIKLKKALDPACILGLDNMFPKEHLL